MDYKNLREQIRRVYNFRCGYCEVHETEIGSELEIDHFHPVSRGGSDDVDNLVYCCATCNRFKGDFWPQNTPFTTTHRLLHPKREDTRQHLKEDLNGRLIALTATGACHIERLHLNRAPLVALRQARRANAQIQRDLATARKQEAQLRERITVLEGELQKVLNQLTKLLAMMGER